MNKQTNKHVPLETLIALSIKSFTSTANVCIFSFSVGTNPSKEETEQEQCQGVGRKMEFKMKCGEEESMQQLLKRRVVCINLV